MAHKFWILFTFGCSANLSLLFLFMSVLSGNDKGMVYYGVSTMIIGGVFTALMKRWL